MVSYLIDTNVLSERIKKSPNQGVVTWLDNQPELIVSVATFYEIEFGIKEVQRKNGKQAKILIEWFATLTPHLQDISITRNIVLKAAELSSKKIAQGLSVNINDMLIAATALETTRVLVTRNLKDFDRIPGLTLLNPFI